MDVSLNLDLFGMEDAVIFGFGAMCLDDRDITIAQSMADDLRSKGKDLESIVFFDTVQPYIQKIAERQVVCNPCAEDAGIERVYATLIECLIISLEWMGNDEDELLAAAQTRWPKLMWSKTSKYEPGKGWVHL